jgi:hypothetical protein
MRLIAAMHVGHHARRDGKDDPRTFPGWAGTRSLILGALVPGAEEGPVGVSGAVPVSRGIAALLATMALPS